MSLEVWATIASVGTFLVIAVTAVVAAIQLRHLRASNQIAAVMKLADVIASEEFQRSRRFIREDLDARLRDPAFRRELDSVPLGEAARPLLVVGNCYEELGTFIKRGIIDQDMACDLWSAMTTGDWVQMSPAIAIIRRKHGPSVWENFEYMVEISERWFARFPHGTLPKNPHRVPLTDVWLSEDQTQRSEPR